MEVLPKPLVMKLAKMKVNGYMRKYAKINVKGLENIARNLCAQRGLDYEKEMAEFRKKLGQ